MPPDRTNRPARAGFFELIPRRSMLVFLGAVFFVFAPVNLLLGIRFAEPPPLAAALVLAVLSGGAAACWAATFTFSRAFAIGIVVLTLSVMVLSGPLALSALRMRPQPPSFAGLAIVGTIVLGYVLFVAFIKGQGRRTLRLMTEMALARRIHASLVPAIERADSRFEVDAVSAASSEMGGDLVDVVDHGAATDFILADVSGHGVKAGVVMGMLKSAIRMGLCQRRDLQQLLRDVNHVLEQTTSAEMYATVALLRLHHAEKKLECVLAGHSQVLLQCRSETTPRRIGERGFPVGLLPLREYEVHMEPLSAGDLLAVWTDGLDETTDEAGRELGHEAVERVIVESADRPLSEIRRAVFDVVGSHGPQQDDRSLLLIRVGIQQR